METYGFRDPDYIEPEQFKSFQKSYSSILIRRATRWKQLINQDHLVRGPRLKRFCRKGIPSEFRAHVWLTLSGAYDEMKRYPKVYKDAVNISPPKNLNATLIADLPRTFPENVYFQYSKDAHCKLGPLQRVLSAFAVAFPKIGYCQGLNYLAATLLLVLDGSTEESEEQVFWLLYTLTHNILPSYYIHGMIDVQVDCMVLEELLRLKTSAVHNILKGVKADCLVLATKWFMCLFADVLPTETVLRIYDCLFYEGDKILFRVSLALIKLHQNAIIECKFFPNVILTFRNMCHDTQTLYCHEFLRAMFKLPGSLSKSKILKLRSKFRIKVSNNMEALDKIEFEYAAKKLNHQSTEEEPLTTNLA